MRFPTGLARRHPEPTLVDSDLTAGIPWHPASGQIESLDGIRFISIMIVFVGHAGWGDIIPGGFGVTIFFFLSGYLITTLLRRELTRHGSISLKKFYLRRAIRIWPAFYLVLTACVVMSITGVLSRTLAWDSVALQYLHLANYDQMFNGNAGIPAGTEVYWSLAVEEHFYLLFPLAFMLMSRRGLPLRRIAAVLATACVVILAWRLVLILGLDADMHHTYYASDTRFDSILLGCILAVWHNPALDPDPLTERTWKYVAAPAGLLAIVATFAIRDESFRETFRYSVQGIALMPLFWCAIRYPAWGPMRWLNTRTAAFMGRLSYAFYLVHFTVILWLAERLPRIGQVPRAGIAFALSTALAYLVHLAVERPLAPIRHRLGRS